MDPLKIIVAYSDMFFYQATVEALESEGYRVFTARKKEEALEILEKERPDCLITGIGLALKDGEDLVSVTRQQYPDVKIIATSTWGPEGDEKGYRKIGIPFLAIPYRPTDLFKLLKKLL